MTPFFPSLKWDHCIESMHATGNFKVLRRIDELALQLPAGTFPPASRIQVLIVDTETTDLGPTAQAIELGLTLVCLDEEGRFLGVMDAYTGQEEPTLPISEEASQVHGLTLDDVKGKAFDNDVVASFVERADFVVAHNAEFDRPVVERRFQSFERLPWVCSLREIDWVSLGQRRAGLEALVSAIGCFHGAHRAQDDCLALVAVLSAPLSPESPNAQWQALLRAKDQSTYKVWAVQSPFEKKDLLKARGYRWVDGTAPGTFKAWVGQVAEAALEEELDWLRNSVYGRGFSVPIEQLTAYERWSTRSGARRPSIG